ncbi:T9SS type A sorting domain-containing protein [Christiangramia flava]|uniref:Uncharacterized protein n=1 Tax=Christiangramia flava JLT2011 TaxID=1229726 RepID=A0A1L7I9V3_9FLAO|nr:T9SS type A sorting domain-containing protein [Christiangramia flava]APU69973.1 hypothetical protein GRFL_3249 [Christiangramia flava JLT2011]OSS39458.1 hypothetical protein C723_1360 [Christiangramia flava JLT2011]
MNKPAPKFLISLFLVLFSVAASAQGTFTVSDYQVIPAGTVAEYDQVTITNSGELHVEGTLIVNGDLLMGNQAAFSMGGDAVVIVRRNFEGGNKVDISISSYLIIGGNFTKNGAAGQETINIEDGNIYILGDVSGWNSVTPCDNYDGNTETAQDQCQYGDEEDLSNNYEDLPPTIADELNCFQVEKPADITACDGASVSFSVSEIPDVIYQWQYKAGPGATFTDIAGSANTLDLNVDASMNGFQYRVKIKPVDPESTCKISFSPPAVLNIPQQLVWTGNVDADWDNAGNWLCGNIPGPANSVIIPSNPSNLPIIYAGSIAEVNNLTLSGNTSKLTISYGNLHLYGKILGAGKIDAVHGKILFSGNTAQTIPNAIFVNNAVESLELDNGSGLTSNSSLEIIKSLKLSQGNLTLNESLKLISNDTITALIDGSGSGTITGEVTMQRFLENTMGYKYFSSPFTNSIVGDFSAFVDLTSDFPHFYAYDENRRDADQNDLSGWTPYINSASALNVLEAYAVNFGGTAGNILVELTGIVNNGSQSISLQNHNRKYTKGFNLVGNPYPSPIDWSKSGWTKTNIDDAVYFFQSSGGQYAGAYTSFINGISSDGSSTAIIPSMQGFFVHVSDDPSGNYPVSGTLGMDNSVRVNDYDQQFYKTPINSRPLIRLSAGFKNGQKDALVLYAESFATENYENDLDALKMLNTNAELPNFYSFSEDREISINAIDFEAKKQSIIPLGLQVQKNGQIEIQLQDLENFDSEKKIFLCDEQSGKTWNLLKEKAALHLQKGTYNYRFSLLLSTGTAGNMISTAEIFHSLNNSGNASIQMNLEKSEIGMLYISNLNGQLLKEFRVSGLDKVQLSGILSSGVYLATYISPNRKLTKKIILP